MTPSISHITKKLLVDSISTSELKSVLREYKTMLIDSTDFPFNEAEDNRDISLDQGIAIALNSAASCLDDPIRTRKFIRGTKLAIESKLREKEQVHILYAGTGPFATLILPLLSHFSADQLKVTLLEINPRSVENVTRIIEYFGFQNHIHEIRCADATQTVFENPLSFDILLTETMQHALQREQQVLISSHLLNQMAENAILIPQSIDVELTRWSSKENHFIQSLMKVDAEFIHSQQPINSSWTFERKIELDGTSFSDLEMLAISTSIQVYEKENIAWNESGLTAPKIIGLPYDFRNYSELTLCYVLSPEPGFELRTTEYR